jgi:hypothetical protein
MQQPTSLCQAQEQERQEASFHISLADEGVPVTAGIEDKPADLILFLGHAFNRLDAIQRF